MAVSKRLRSEILRRDNKTCQNCGSKAPDVPLTIDHVIPVTLGGSDEPANLQTLCAPCNSGKSATPPDAATVARVSDDARRWADALKAAAEKMLSDSDARSAEVEQFDGWWCEWTYGEGKGQARPIPRDPGWEQSIGRFLAAGLPMPILKDCLEVAMSRRKVGPHETWRYFCGVAWGRIRDLQDAAKEMVAPAPAPETRSLWDSEEFHRGRYDVAHDILSNFQPQEQERRRAEWRTKVDYPDDDVEIEVDLAQDIVLSALTDVARLTQAVTNLLMCLPADDVDRWRRSAEALCRHHMDDEFTEVEVFVQLARLGEEERRLNEANAFLETLLPEAKTEWIAYAVAHHGTLSRDAWYRDLTPAEAIIKAAACAELLGPGGHHHVTMCASRGEHIAVCPRPAEYRVYIAEAPCCAPEAASEHQGHKLCGHHVERMVDGLHTNREGVKLTARDFEPLTHPEEVP